MKSIGALLFILTLAHISHADIIKCTYAEPFANLEYSTTQNKLKIVAPSTTGTGTKTTTHSNVYFQILGAGHFIIQKNGSTILDLKITNNGSDGMSGLTYPYSATWVSNNNYIGGCTSNFLPML